jgi:excisionase family DNA binding protein
VFLEPDVPVLFTAKQVGSILNISRTQFYELMKKGEIESVRIGHARRVTQNQLMDYIKKLENHTD